MLNRVNFNRYDNSFYQFPPHPFTAGPPRMNLSHCDITTVEEMEAIYASDEFRMYAYKIKKCTRNRSHDWTECPYAHRGEKATRRDPRRVPYVGVACPSFRNGSCVRGDNCEYAHGLFEFWLHPSRYRTRACNAGRYCQRRVCFFAHSPEEMRPESNYCCPFLHKGKAVKGGDGTLRIGVIGREKAVASTSAPAVVGTPVRLDGGSYFEGVSEFLDSLRNKQMNNQEMTNREPAVLRRPIVSVKVDETESETPQIDWVSELVN